VKSLRERAAVALQAITVVLNWQAGKQ